MSLENYIQALRNFNEKLKVEAFVTALKKFNKNNPNHAPAGNEDGGQFTSSAVAVYQSTSFDAINNELRYDKPDVYATTIAELDALSTDVTTDELYRGLDSSYTKYLADKFGIKDTGDIKELEKKLTGVIIHDKGFLSTTRVLSVAADFARDKGTGRTTIMQISGTKKGIEVLKHINNYRARKEKEFIIKRGTSLFVKKVSLSKSGVLILYTHTI